MALAIPLDVQLADALQVAVTAVAEPRRRLLIVAAATKVVAADAAASFVENSLVYFHIAVVAVVADCFRVEAGMIEPSVTSMQDMVPQARPILEDAVDQEEAAEISLVLLTDSLPVHVAVPQLIHK